MKYIRLPGIYVDNIDTLMLNNKFLGFMLSYQGVGIYSRFWGTGSGVGEILDVTEGPCKNGYGLLAGMPKNINKFQCDNVGGA